MRNWRAAQSTLGAVGIFALAGMLGCTRTPIPGPRVPTAPEGSVAGQLVRGEPDGAAGQVVVYLEPVETQRPSRVAGRRFQVRHRSGRLEPEFLAAQVGDRVVFRNDDEIFHNVFSSSTTLRFDLGILKRGEHRTIRLDAPGVIPLYSSLHEQLSGLIFVAPTDHYTVVEGDHYQLESVPAGRFRLRVWSETHRARPREVVIPAGETLIHDVHLERRG